MPTVQMPDGQLVEMPDNPTFDQLKQLSRLQGERAAPGLVQDLKQGAIGLAEGALALPGLAARIGEYAFTPEQASKNPSVSEQFKSMTPAPETDSQKYSRSIGEGVGGAVTMPGGLVRNAISGVGSGLGSEVGERTLGGTTGRVVGGLLGGAATAIPSLFAGNKASLASRALDGVTPEELAKAQLMMQNAEKSGVKLTLGQALERPSNVDALEGALANSELGDSVQNILRSQPVSTANAARGQVVGLPGEILPDAQAAELLQRGATETIQNAKNIRSMKVKPLYESGGSMTQREIADLQGSVLAAAEKYPPGTATGDALRSLSSRLLDEKGKPLSDMETINNVLKDVASGVKAPNLAKAPVDANGQRILGEEIAKIRSYMGEKHPKFAKANALYQKLSDELVDPLKASVIGTIAKRAGYQEGTPSIEGLARQVFKKGTNPDAKVSNILTLQHELGKAGQNQAFTTSAKSYLSNVLGDTVNLASGGADARTAENIAKAFSGTINQNAGLRDTLVGMARSQKMPDDALYPGFENMIRIVRAAGKRPQRVMGMNEQEISKDASENALSNFARVFSFMPVEKVAVGVERRYSQAAMTALDRMVSTPEGVKELQALAKLNPQSRAAQNALTTLVATYAGSDVNNP